LPKWQVDERGYMALDDRLAKLSYAKSFGEERGVDFQFGLAHGNFLNQKSVEHICLR
jgi:hypothetical protein